MRKDPLGMIDYGYVRELKISLDSALQALPNELKRKGFELLGVTHIHDEMRRKLGVEFHRYVVASVCNLTLSYRALTREENFGLILPCTIAMYEKDGRTHAGVIRPTIFITLTNNDWLHEGAALMEKKLCEVIERLEKAKPREKVSHAEPSVPVGQPTATA